MELASSYHTFQRTQKCDFCLKKKMLLKTFVAVGILSTWTIVSLSTSLMC